ncbi:MAG: glycosyltransferase family 2 protein [Gemmatimonadetes bacterium]|nr:glycosyltransferase family 2 protein [Gemmatimonadota bacterium]
MADPLFSVIVCTLNRAPLLATALAYLCRQSLARSEYEVLVVDNNSADGTAAVTAEYAAQCPNVRHVLERKQGHSHARNRGLGEARGQYAAYLDDDCRAPTDWLANARRAVETVSPAVLGGPYLACYESPKPRWYRDDYGSHVQAEKRGELGRDEYLSGGNIFFRRALLEQLGGFDPKLGMRGRAIGYGDEVALLQYVRAHLPRELIYFDPSLFVYHVVRPEKMQLSWAMRERFVSGRFDYLVFGGGDARALSALGIVAQALRAVVGLLASAAKGATLRDRQLYPYLQNYLYERTFFHVRRLGELYQQVAQPGSLRVAGRKPAAGGV